LWSLMQPAFPLIIKTCPVLFWMLGFLFWGSCKSQKSKSAEPFKFSSTTDFYYAEKFESKEKKRFKYLYAYNMRKVLYGNQCVNDVTHQFGYEYIPAFDSAKEPRNDLQIWFHNFFTSVGITFKHGLFWKKKVKKRIKYCAESSGDFNG
jgi:hypothetical protein